MKTKKLTAITFSLMLTISALIASMPAINAAVVEVDTFCFVMASPDPVQVNQPLIVTYQLDKVSPTATGVEEGDHFTGFTVKITKPDGTTENMGPYEAWSISGAFFIYTPSMIGTYTFQASFPGQWINTTDSASTYQRHTEYWFKPSTSEILEVTVQQDPIETSIEPVPIPTDYWERPIYSENKDWWQVADNWLMQGYDYAGRGPHSNTAFAPYTAAPNSAHVLWTRPLWFGGIGGGQFGDKAYYSGLSYEQPYRPLILQGRIIYTEKDPSNNIIFGTRCLDLYTGEELWYLDGIDIEFAQIFDIENPNEHGLIAHLWSRSGGSSNTTYQLYDGFTGIPQIQITNVSRGTTKLGPNGEVLNYILSRGTLTLWNSTKAIFAAFPWQGIEPGGIYDLTAGRVIDGSAGIEWEVPVDTPGRITLCNLEAGLIVTDNRDTSTYPFVWTQAGYSTETGQQLWVKNRTNIYGQHGYITRDPSAIRNGVYAQLDQPKMQFHIYNAETGNEQAVTDPLPGGWAFWCRNFEIAYGKLYVASYDGYVRAFSVEDGSLEWEYYFGNAGYETPTGSWTVYAGPTIADGKIFVTNDEHSPNSVLPRGNKLYALNTDNGEEVWKISGMFRIPAVADGLLTATNSYDGKIYTFGKGPSEITVSAPQIAIQKGSSVMITGTVTDQSPGQKGTPAMSDESMSAWMEYLHMQKPIPGDAKGVTVTLSAIDPNGNYQDIGEVTSDMSGNFGMSWKPPVEGDYMIMATFEGSESYGSSFDITYLVVGPAPSPAIPIEPEEATAEAPFITTEVAILAAVAIASVIGVAAYWVLRKRK